MPSEQLEPANFNSAEFRIMRTAFHTLRSKSDPELMKTQEQLLKLARQVVFTYRPSTPDKLLDETAKNLVK